MAGSSNDNVWNPTEAGSIGNRLISRYNILINLPAKEMHLQPNNLSKLPFDINIKSIQFGWNQQDQLSILAAPPHPEISKKIGVPIQSLRNVSVEELIRNPEKLAELIMHAPEDDLLIQFADNTELTL